MTRISSARRSFELYRAIDSGRSCSACVLFSQIFQGKRYISYYYLSSTILLFENYFYLFFFFALPFLFSRIDNMLFLVKVTLWVLIGLVLPSCLAPALPNRPRGQRKARRWVRNRHKFVKDYHLSSMCKHIIHRIGRKRLDPGT